MNSLIINKYNNQTGIKNLMSFLYRYTQFNLICSQYSKDNGFPYSLPSIWARSWSQCTDSQPSVQPAVCCHYFRQACGYLPSCRASPPLGQYKVILLG